MTLGNDHCMRRRASSRKVSQPTLFWGKCPAGGHLPGRWCSLQGSSGEAPANFMTELSIRILSCQFLKNWADTHHTAVQGVLNYFACHCKCWLRCCKGLLWALRCKVFCHLPSPSTCTKIYQWFCYFLQPLKFSCLKVSDNGISVHGWAICKFECWLYI